MRCFFFSRLPRPVRLPRPLPVPRPARAASLRAARLARPAWPLRLPRACVSRASPAAPASPAASRGPCGSRVSCVSRAASHVPRGPCLCTPRAPRGPQKQHKTPTFLWPLVVLTRNMVHLRFYGSSWSLRATWGTCVSVAPRGPCMQHGAPAFLWPLVVPARNIRHPRFCGPPRLAWPAWPPGAKTTSLFRLSISFEGHASHRGCARVCSEEHASHGGNARVCYEEHVSHRG